MILRIVVQVNELDINVDDCRFRLGTVPHVHPRRVQKSMIVLRLFWNGSERTFRVYDPVGNDSERDAKLEPLNRTRQIG